MKQISADELMHHMKQIARAEAGNGKASTFGYVSAYDPATHMVQVVLPTLRETDDNGQPVPLVSDWLPLGTTWAGAGFGLQVAPLKAAATPQDPTQGEQVLVQILDDETGLAACPVFFFNQKFPPPGGLQPGEAIIQHTSGRTIKFTADGKIQINGGSTPVAVEGSGINITALLQAINTACMGVTGYVPIPVPPAPLAPTAAVASGQGAQDFVAPAAGGS